MKEEMESGMTIEAGLCIETPPPPFVMVIFGASGDLTRRKLVPALFRLCERNLLPDRFHVIGCGRTPMTDASFRQEIEGALDGARDLLERFIGRFHYLVGTYDDPALYRALTETVGRLAEPDGNSSRLFYLAVPPDVSRTITEQLSAAGLAHADHPHADKTRVVIEKPFGSDLASALKFAEALERVLSERQIYRIDHYLGKETVQNILMFRFANTIFEPVWSSRYIDNIQITVAESIGVGHRAGYFDRAGLLRDIFQNHMLQMLALVAMEPPALFESDGIRDGKVDVLRSIRPFDEARARRDIIRGQYMEGEIEGAGVPGYREEAGVAGNSATATYVAARVEIDTPRWRGMPFYLRSGKRLPRKESKIVVEFKPVTHRMFSAFPQEAPSRNHLVLNVQPEEGFRLSIEAKSPGPKLCMSILAMNFRYQDMYGDHLPDAYERLLLDVMLGDQTLFIRGDDVMESWRLLAPVLDLWEQYPDAPLYPYPAGTWGPGAADELLHREGFSWLNDT